MKRILTILVTLGIVLMASPAFAGKPSIAILGLEIEIRKLASHRFQRAAGKIAR